MNKSMTKVVIYGATGYTAKLFTRELLNAGVRPVLAGRSDAVHVLAKKTGLPSLVFKLDDEEAIQRHLQGATVLFNLAGPFVHTNQALIRACLATGCHYIDIAGEVNEMASAHAFDDAARKAGIMLMPGAGFGVVPTDIAAKMAADLLPDATDLTILFATEGGASRGTLGTFLKDIDQPGVKRVNTKLVTANPAESSADFTVGGKTFHAVYNPWRADLFTAGLSTGVANIKTYSTYPGFIVQMMKGKRLWLRDLLVKHLLRFLPEGPSDKQLAHGHTYIMAIARAGKTQRTVAFRGPEAYRFTALCLRELTALILAGHAKPGYQTPATFDKTLLHRIEGITWDTDNGKAAQENGMQEKESCA